MRRFLLLAVLCASVLSFPGGQSVSAATSLSGLILLQVERNGEAWYVYPVNGRRYSLSTPTKALEVMRRLGLGITDANLNKIPIAGTSATGDLALRQRLAGRILLQVERQGQAWYVHPRTLVRYSLGRPAEALRVMQQVGVGISEKNLLAIPVGTTVDVTSIIKRGSRTVATSRGSFTIDYLYFNRTTPGLQIMTDTANTADCDDDCPDYPLATFVNRRGAAAGIHGAYACPPDYASCAHQSNYYFAPIYNSFLKVMINNDRIKYTTQPILAFDTANKPYYFHDARDFKGVNTFQTTYGVKLQAAISNGPAILENRNVVVKSTELDSKQATVKSFRGAIGYDGDMIYLAVVRGATVPDAAAALKAFGLEYALNLDGGGSTAMYRDGSYLLGPGRELTNVILVLLS